MDSIVLCSVERERVRVENPSPSPLTTLPLDKGLPLDWVDPTFYNEELTLLEKWDFVKDGVRIALPSKEYCTPANWHLWRDLKEKEFMERFGNDVLKDYNVPTEEQFERARRRLIGYDSDESEQEHEEFEQEHEESEQEHVDEGQELDDFLGEDIDVDAEEDGEYLPPPEVDGDEESSSSDDDEEDGPDGEMDVVVDDLDEFLQGVLQGEEQGEVMEGEGAWDGFAGVAHWQ